MVQAIKDVVQGVQVTAPAGRIAPALEVLVSLKGVSGKSKA